MDVGTLMYADNSVIEIKTLTPVSSALVSEQVEKIFNCQMSGVRIRANNGMDNN